MDNAAVTSATYVVCIDNAGYEVSLERHKIYQVVADEAAEADDLRVVDESGEDYLYARSRFVPIAVPEAVRQSLAQVSG